MYEIKGKKQKSLNDTCIKFSKFLSAEGKEGVAPVPGLTGLKGPSECIVNLAPPRGIRELPCMGP